VTKQNLTFWMIFHFAGQG